MSDPNVSEDLIRQHVSMCEGYLDEAEDLAKRKKEWRSEVKGVGLDPALIEKTVKIKRADKDMLQETEALLDIYKRAAGV